MTATGQSATPLLEVEELRTYFGRRERPARAVDGVSLRLDRGETAALVGESGCGKTVTAMSLARLVPQPPAFFAGGSVRFDGRDVLALPEAALRDLRGGRIAYIFQDPANSLNPVFTIGNQLAEVLRLHRPEACTRAEMAAWLGRVGLPNPEACLDQYPYALSGGMQQRAMIAMALSGRPDLLVADEPTTALDVTIQAQILRLLRDLQQELTMAILLITHNLGLVAEIAHRVYIMYAGQIVEEGPVEAILTVPRHPYTRALLAAVPRLGGGSGRLQGIDGFVPGAAAFPEGCRFHPRCRFARAACRRDPPALERDGAQAVRCPFWQELAAEGGMA